MFIRVEPVGAPFSKRNAILLRALGIKHFMGSNKDTQVVVMAGGEAKRLGMNMPKALVKLGETTLIDRLVEFYRKNGINDFTFVLAHGDKEVTKHIEQNGWNGINSNIVYDYEKGIGNGKAFKQALEEGKIDRSRRSIYVQPDDIFLDPNIPSKVLEEHVRAVNSLGVVASDIVEKAHQYPFGVDTTDEKGLVIKFEEKPLVPLLTSTGMRIFEPAAYEYFIKLIDLKKPGNVGFEYAILPRLAEERKIYAIVIPQNSWVTMNTQKDLDQLKRMIEEGKLPSS